MSTSNEAVTKNDNFHQGALTDVVLQASKRSKEFLVDVLDAEYTGAKNDMQRQITRQSYGVGTGVIGQVNDAIPDATLTLDNPMVGKYPTDYLEYGSGANGGPVMFSSAADAATSAAYTVITAITGNNDITVNSATDIADNDYVYLAHANGTVTPTVSNVNAEIMGLKGLVDDSTNIDALQGITRSTDIWWKSYVSSNATQRSLTDALMHSTFLEAKKKGDPTLGITHFDVYSAYGQLLSADRRYTSAMKLPGGFTGISFNELPIVPDYDHPYDELNFIDGSTLSMEDLAPMSFLNEDGSILDRSSTTPAWNFTLRLRLKIASLQSNLQNKTVKLLETLGKYVGYNGEPKNIYLWFKRTMLKNNIIETISIKTRKGMFNDYNTALI